MKRWFRFSLRTMLVLMVVLSVVFGLAVRKGRRQRAVTRWVLESGGSVTYAFHRNDGQQLGGPRWLSIETRKDFFAIVVSANVQHSDLSPIVHLPLLKRLEIGSVPTVDLSPVASLSELEELTLNGIPNLTDISAVRELTNLKTLALFYTGVRDLSPLETLPELEEIHLMDEHPPDLSSLAEMENLRFLSLHLGGEIDWKALAKLKQARVIYLECVEAADDDVTDLKQSLPNCRIDVQTNPGNLR